MRDRFTLFTGLILFLAVSGCDGKKEGSASLSGETKAEPVQLTLAPLPLKITVPKGSRVVPNEFTKDSVGVERDEQFAFDVTASYLRKIDRSSIPGVDKPNLEKVHIEKGDLVLWERRGVQGTNFQFLMLSKVGGRLYLIHSSLLGDFSRTDVDAMIEAGRTLDRSRG